MVGTFEVTLPLTKHTKMTTTITMTQTINGVESSESEVAVPWDEQMPSLMDDGALSTASSISKHSELLPQKLSLKYSDDSTDHSTNPSVTDDNPKQATVDDQPNSQDTSGKKKKKRTLFSLPKKMKTPFREVKTSAQKKKKEEEIPPEKTPHTLHSEDDRGNVECYILDANIARMEEAEKVKALAPVGLKEDHDGNVECRALDERSLRTEEMQPPPICEGEKEHPCKVYENVCSQTTSPEVTEIMDCSKETVKCSFYDQIYAQLMDSLPDNCTKPTHLNESATCIDQDTFENSKEVVDGIQKEVKGGIQKIDNTLDCIVGGLFPDREDSRTIKGLTIANTNSSDTQAEI